MFTRPGSLFWYLDTYKIIQSNGSSTNKGDTLSIFGSPLLQDERDIFGDVSDDDPENARPSPGGSGLGSGLGWVAHFRKRHGCLGG